ncbi:Ig-like domain-containing protein [Nocardioides sp. J54]|uniref:Ig-like domain-containing protein n=1 Tax=Nocardioides sp. J54 TaxID=935866 RepID=UPI00048DBAA6|nr:Ig-like domain-containing protein [Nocardioides sp. J54]
MRRTTAIVLLGLVVLTGSSRLFSGFSDATFTSTSANVGTVRAAADWTAPTVAVTSPGTPVQGTVTLAATASDAESGISSVTLQYLAPGTTSWATLCTDTVAPYTCSWATGSMADGTYDLRARATNGAGYTTVSEVVRTTVANNVLVVLSDPGEVVRGNVSMSATVFNGGPLAWSVTVQYAPAGTTAWKPLCSGLSAPFACTWSTTGLANGEYDLRAVATFLLTTATSAVVRDVQVDNLAPTVSMTDPGSPLSGTVTFGATATDAHSGVQQVTLQHQRSGTSTWQPLCTTTAEPYTCRFATTALVDGTYSFRAVATDVAGNTTTSAAVTGRVVDNTVSSVSLDDPGTVLTGTVAVSAQANSTAGVTSVRIQHAPSGSSSWTDLCTATAAPYSCTWDTRSVADGNRDLRAVLLDGRGGTTTSAVLTRKVDNSPLRAIDVQATNGDGTAGRLDAGDTLTLTWSEVVTPASLSAGWDGAAVPVTLRLRDGNVNGVGTGPKNDVLDVQRGSSTVNVGSVALREDYVKTKKQVSFNATMTATTVSVDGADRTVVTIVLGTVSSGSGLRTVTTTPGMVWSPSGAATSPTGGACSTTPVTETGAADRDF